MSYKLCCGINNFISVSQSAPDSDILSSQPMADNIAAAPTTTEDEESVPEEAGTSNDESQRPHVTDDAYASSLSPSTTISVDVNSQSAIETDDNLFPAHSLAVSCINNEQSASSSCPGERHSIAVMKSDENQTDSCGQIVKQKSRTLGSLSQKKKPDKSKDKRKNKFWSSFKFKTSKKPNVGNEKATASSLDCINNSDTNLEKSNELNISDNGGVTSHENAIHGANAYPVTETIQPSNGNPLLGPMSQINMGAGPSSPLARQMNDWELLRQVVPAPTLPTPSSRYDTSNTHIRIDLRSIAQLPPEVADDANIFHALERDSLRGHVAYPHIQYPTSGSRTSASGSGSSPSDSMWSLTCSFQNQCSTNLPQYPAGADGASVPHYPGADSSSLSTFGQRDDFAPPIPCLPPPRSGGISRTEYTQVDYIHFLVPDLLEISRCGFYWGVMDRYEAERFLDNKPEGTFLLRDSAQEEFLFSVSFRRYGRSLHARIDQWNHRFSFDTHDPGVFSADSVTALIEHYKDPSCCMFFEPMLTIPLNRNYPFSLQHLCRSVICKKSNYDDLNRLPLPKSLKEYLKYYHYKLKIRVRRMEVPY